MAQRRLLPTATMRMARVAPAHSIEVSAAEANVMPPNPRLSNRRVLKPQTVAPFANGSAELGLAIDRLRELMLAVGFYCHKRPAREFTVRAYFAQKQKPLLNPRIQLQRLDSKGAHRCRIVIHVINEADDELATRLRQFRSDRDSPFDAIQENTPDGFIHGTFQIRTVVSPDGEFDTAEAERLRAIFARIHSVLGSPGLSGRADS